MNRVFLALALVAGVGIYLVSTRLGGVSDAVSEAADPVLTAPSGAIRATMTGDLRSLVNAEATYQTIHGAFTSSLADLGFGASADVEVRVLAASSTGFSAEATHPALRGSSCVVFDGDATPPTTRRGTRAASPRTPLCDS